MPKKDPPRQAFVFSEKRCGCWNRAIWCPKCKDPFDIIYGYDVLRTDYCVPKYLHSVPAEHLCPKCEAKEKAQLKQARIKAKALLKQAILDREAAEFKQAQLDREEAQFKQDQLDKGAVHYPYPSNAFYYDDDDDDNKMVKQNNHKVNEAYWANIPDGQYTEDPETGHLIPLVTAKRKNTNSDNKGQQKVRFSNTVEARDGSQPAGNPNPYYYDEKTGHLVPVPDEHVRDTEQPINDGGSEQEQDNGDGGEEDEDYRIPVVQKLMTLFQRLTRRDNYESDWRLGMVLMSIKFAHQRDLFAGGD